MSESSDDGRKEEPDVYIGFNGAVRALNDEEVKTESAEQTIQKPKFRGMNILTDYFRRIDRESN